MSKDSSMVDALLNAPTSGRILSKDMDKYVKDCCSGDTPPCKFVCPLDLDVLAFFTKLQKGNFNSAYTIYRDQVLFPEIVCSLCPAPCDQACVRKDIDDPLSMKKLERAVIDFVRSTDPVKYNIPKKNVRVAIIGAGLCGLSCATKLFSHGYDVTIFEKSDRVGGCLWQIADPEMFLPEIEKQMKHIDYEFKPNHEVKSLDELAEFPAILIATGKDGENFGMLEGYNPDSLGTRKDGVFIAGGLIGEDPLRAIENGIRASISIESFLKTGRMHEMMGINLKKPSNFKVNTKRVQKTSAVGTERYTKEEAKEEALRCLKCDCHECFEICELMQSYKKMPRKIVDDVRMTFNPVEGLQPRVATRLLSSCNDCGLCGDLCPVDIDMGEFLLNARRIMHREGSLPPVFHDYWLRDMAFTDSEQCYLAKNAPGESSSEQVFFPGCQLGASDPRYVIDSYNYLREKLPQTGLILSCCGAPTEWAGDEKGMKEKVDSLRATWKEMGSPRFIVACPTCKKMLKRYLPEIETDSLYTVMAKQGITVPTEKATVAIFDPCASRYAPEMQDSVRDLAAAAGITAEELSYHGDEALCCGHGGHIYPANGGLQQRIVKDRIEMSELPYVTYCINCRDIFAREGKPCQHILDVVFGLNDGERQAPSLSQNRQNRRDLKAQLMSQIWQEEVPKVTEEIKIEIPEELNDKLNQQLIVAEDIKAVIAYCEKTGNKLLDPETGHFIGHLKQGVMTYWVIYEVLEDRYKVINAYCHRMQIEGE